MVTVAIDDVDEPGKVTFRILEPREGVEFVPSDVADPDVVVTGVTWQWASSSTRSSWAPIAGATAMNYTPTADVGKYLRVTATYTDALGANKTAVATSAHRVAAARDVADNKPRRASWTVRVALTSRSL